MDKLSKILILKGDFLESIRMIIMEEARITGGAPPVITM